MHALVGLTRTWVALAIICFATQVSAAQTKRSKALKQTVALVPAHADGTIAKAQLESIDRALANSAGQHADVIAIRALDKRTKNGFAAAVRQCKGDGGCLARLARLTKVEVIVVPSAKSDNDGTTVTATVAGANDTIHRVSFSFATAADLNSVISSNSGALFTSGNGNTDEPALESLAALPLEPLEPATPPHTTVTPPATEPQTVAKADTKNDESKEDRKGRNSKVAKAPPPVVVVPEPPPSALVDANASPMGTTQVMPSPRRETKIGWGTYVGAGVAAVGVASITYGIIQYLDHKSIVNDANGDPSLTQREAEAKDQDAKDHYDKSRTGLYAGVPLLIVGAALITWDVAIADHNKHDSAMTDQRLKLSIIPDPRGGAAGAMTFTW